MDLMLNIMFTVVGMQYVNRTVEDVAACKSVTFELEPDNKFDKNAIRVLDPEGVALGHVGASECASLRKTVEDLGQSFPYTAMVRDAIPSKASVKMGVIVCSFDPNEED